jgi:hypothetical protein
MSKPAFGAFGRISWGRRRGDHARGLAKIPWPWLSGARALAYPHFLPTPLSFPSHIQAIPGPQRLGSAALPEGWGEPAAAGTLSGMAAHA